MSGPGEGSRRSEAWFNDPTAPDNTAIYVERYLNEGLTRAELQSGRPIIGIAQSGSDLTPCHRHHLDLAKRVRDGIHHAGGVAIEFPVHPIHEQGRRPTAAIDRNLACLGLIEILHGYPFDGVVLTTGCDKTTPALLMAAAAVDLPAIVLSGGPMLNGWDGDERIGSGAIVWRCREEYARGEIDYEQFMRRVASGSPSIGHCNTMGTATTMNGLAEALGMSLPGCGAIPAPYRERTQMAYDTGVAAVQVVEQDLRPSTIMTRSAFVNAIKTCAALGGSTNAPIHLQAIANQLGVDLTIHDWQIHGEHIPLLVNCQPAGEYLGEDFHRAGGVPAVLGELLRAGELHGSAMTVTGRTMESLHRASAPQDTKVIRHFDDPLVPRAGFAVMTGNLFDSAIMKKSVIGADFRRRYLSDPDRPGVFRCRAVVFEGPEDYHARINDPDLAIDADCMLVIRGCGPVGYPGSAEVVNMLPPDRLVKEGITTLPCLGDGRQSGTSASPSILNASPEAAVGGGLALLLTGDTIEVDVERNTVNVLLDQDEYRRRARLLVLPELVDQTPWQELYRSTVTQLADGADMLLRGDHRRIADTHGIPRHNH